MKVGIMCMAGDLLHSGHISALREAKANCDYLIACLNCCPTNGRPEKNKPIQSVFERFNQLAAVKYVDEVMVYEDDTDLLTLLGSINYDIRFLGDDYKNKPHIGAEMESLRQIEIYYIARSLHGLSSTSLRERIVKDGVKPR